jgi:very-short-patch-repair endonuclease
MGGKWRSHQGGGKDAALAILAARQHGVVSIRQLLGLLERSEREVERSVAAGRLHRLHQGVYAVGHTSLTARGACLAAVLACGPQAILSHYSAAWLWGLWSGTAAPYEVTTPIPRRRKPPSIVVHYARHLTTADRALVDGIPTTSVPRVLLDLAARDRRGKLRGYLERAEELELLDLGAVHELLDRTRGHHGWGRLRSAAAFYQPPPFTRSGFERRFLEAAQAAKLPRPSVNFNVAGYEVDMYWPEQRFAVELDTYGTHGTRDAFRRDRERQEDLLLAGVAMTRVTDDRFYREANAVIGRVKRLLEDRAVLLGGGGL